MEDVNQGGTVMTIAIDAGHWVGKKVLSLEDQVRLAGIPVLPFDEVMAHKRDYATANRYGIWRSCYLWVIPVAHARIIDYFSYRPLAMIAYLILAGAFGGWFGWGVGAAAEAYLAPLWVAVIAGFVAICIAFFALESYDILERSGWADQYTMSGMYWRKIHYSYFEMGKFVSSFISMPEGIRLQALELQRSLDSTGAKIYVEVFGRDPLIYVVRDNEKVYFGAWNTGTRLDNYGGTPTLH